MKKNIRTPPRPIRKIIRQRPQQRRTQPQPQQAMPPAIPQESLEQILMKVILNTTELRTQRTRIVAKKSFHGVSSEKREGVFINAHGVQETIQEEIKYVSAFRDGTPAGDPALTRCQTCGEMVSIDSLKRCPCGQTCCISRGCGVERKGIWYCSKVHALLTMCKINLRFFS